jgi:ribonuclease P protein component
VLPRAHRLTTSADFSLVTRRGRRARAGGVVVYLLPGAASGAGLPSRAGLVVGRAVGGSVVRHRVARRLRALLSTRIGSLPPGSRMVVRALPDTATDTSARLGADLDRAIVKLVSSAPASSEQTSPGSPGAEPATVRR